MRHPVRNSPRWRPWGVGVLAVVSALTLTACDTEYWKSELSRGFLPEGVTDIATDYTDFWLGTWYWTLGVGVLVWGLMLYAMIRFRRKDSDEGLPPQIQYNVPLEVLYTVVPIFMVVVLFAQTVKMQNRMLDTEQTPSVIVNVIGKQWSWDFNYIDNSNPDAPKAVAWEAGVMADLKAGKPGAEEILPVLYLPVNERVEFKLTARDVVHSFWVPQFLQKVDMIPGKINTFQVTPTIKGTFKGKCAELCGAYHSNMLFVVKVVDRAEYDQQMKALQSRGQSGFLSNSMTRKGSQFEGGTLDNQQWAPKGLLPETIKEGK